MLNAIGLANVGLKAFLADKLPVLAKLGVPAIVNVAGHTVDEYVKVCAALDGQEAVAAIELNVSCPQRVRRAGIRDGRLGNWASWFGRFGRWFIGLC